MDAYGESIEEREGLALLIVAALLFILLAMREVRKAVVPITPTTPTITSAGDINITDMIEVSVAIPVMSLTGVSIEETVLVELGIGITVGESVNVISTASYESGILLSTNNVATVSEAITGLNVLVPVLPNTMISIFETVGVRPAVSTSESVTVSSTGSATVTSTQSSSAGLGEDVAVTNASVSEPSVSLGEDVAVTNANVVESGAGLGDAVLSTINVKPSSTVTVSESAATSVSLGINVAEGVGVTTSATIA